MNLHFRRLSAFLLILMVAALSLPPLAALAQDDLTQQVDLGDGYVISIPADWTFVQFNRGSFSINGFAISGVVSTPNRLAGIGFGDGADAGSVLVEIVNASEDFQIESADVEKAHFGGRTAATYTYSVTGTNENMDVVISLSDGTYGELAFTTPVGGLVKNQDLIDAIITSFDTADAVDADAASTENVALPTEAASSDTVSGAACSVRTSSANSAQLRVGPGTNRGAISFLPADTDVTVDGRIELDDGSVWYQLDKSEAAPNGTAASELWVAAEAVDASGDCDHVGETSAPPIIPMAIAPPSNNSSGDSSGAPSDQSASSTPGMVPQAGTWVLNINATTNASCTGYQNAPIPSSELFDSLTQTYTVNSVRQNSFVYGGDTFTRYADSNSFDGVFVLEDSTVHGRFDVLSPTQMRGELVLSFNLDDGTPCSATNLVLTTHR